MAEQNTLPEMAETFAPPVVSKRADGIYPGLGRAEYERIEAINVSILKHFRRTCAHAREAMLHPDEPTEAMEFGTGTHTAMLEPERFNAEYVVAPKCDRRTNIGKAAWADFEANNRGKTILTFDDMATIRGISGSSMRNETVRELLSSPGRNEVAIVWTDPETGLRCKALIDRITRFLGWTVVADIKTCMDASPWVFASAAAKLGYHEQAAYYLHGLDVLAPAERRWVWIAVEKTRPYEVAVHEPDQDALELGRNEFRAHLRAYKQCIETNKWPGYPSGINSLRLPRWAFNGGDNGTF